MGKKVKENERREKRRRRGKKRFVLIAFEGFLLLLFVCFFLKLSENLIWSEGSEGVKVLPQ